MENIHVEHTAMTQAISKSGDVQASIMDYENQLRGIAEMVKSVWGGRAKAAFDAKHEEISSYIKLNSQDAGHISQGTSQALNISLQADDDSATLINAINGN